MSDSRRGEASLATGTAPAAAVTRLNEPGTTDRIHAYAHLRSQDHDLRELGARSLTLVVIPAIYGLIKEWGLPVKATRASEGEIKAVPLREAAE